MCGINLQHLTFFQHFLNFLVQCFSPRVEITNSTDIYFIFQFIYLVIKAQFFVRPSLTRFFLLT